jgi:signal transduction histidine kinase/CheY-like chemotaxis protein
MYKNKSILIYPIKQNEKTIANIILIVDPYSYISHVFEKHHFGNSLWQWLINSDGKIINYNYNSDTLIVTEKQTISHAIYNNEEGYLTNYVEGKNGLEEIISVYYPIKILNQNLGIVFSKNTEEIYSTQMDRTFYLSGLTFTIITMVAIIFLYFIRRQKKEGKKLKESELSLKKILEYLPIGMVISDTGNKIFQLNRTAIDLFEVDDEDVLIGETINTDFFKKYNFKRDFSEKKSEKYLHVFNNGTEGAILKKRIPVFLNGKNVLIEAFIDVTPIEQARKIEVSANRAKSEFLANMSHEIRTPLNGIIGMTEMFMKANLNSEQGEHINIIKTSADILLSIINDILDFSKIEAGKMILEDMPFSLKKEIKAITDSFTVKAKESKISLETKISPDIPGMIIGDSLRLGQILTNLIGNALKFTHVGKVVVSVERHSEKDGVVELLYKVEDTGIGIPKHKINKIFSSFTQADTSTTRNYGGTGLGTTISKQLVELMKGKIWIESPSSIYTDDTYPGSKFCFIVPSVSYEKVLKDLDYEKITSLNQIKALIIGKDPQNEIEPLLNNMSISFDSAFSAIEAIGIIRISLAEINPYKIVFIENSVEFDGIEIAKILHEENLTIRFICVVLSSNHKIGNHLKCVDYEIDKYFISPYESQEIQQIFKDTFPNLQATSQLSESPVSKKDLSILVAEDNLINQKVAYSIFKKLGYKIEIANNGVEALDMVAKNRYDIIFMDIMMPEKDGIEATIDLRKNGFISPIVAMTADASETNKNHAISIGMDDYITKPVKTSALQSVLFKYFKN